MTHGQSFIVLKGSYMAMAIALTLLITALIAVIFYPLGKRLGARISPGGEDARGEIPRWTSLATVVGVLGTLAIVAWVILDGSDFAVLTAIVGLLTVVQTVVMWRRLRSAGRR